MINTITLDLGYMPVEFRGDRGVRTREFTAYCFQWIRLIGITHKHILEKITWRAEQLN